MGADQHPIIPGSSPTALTLDLATLGSSAPGVLHRFHWGATTPVGPKPCLLSGSLAKLAPSSAPARRLDRLLHALVCQLVERDEHESAGHQRLAAAVQQVLLAPLVIGAGLHRPLPSSFALAVAPVPAGQKVTWE